MTTEDFSVDGDVAVITGSSSGIGRAIAERYAADGVDVVVSSRDQNAVDDVAEAINDSDASGTAIGVRCDVRDWEAIEALVATTEERLGPIDVLVNNAGASFESPTMELSENAWATIVEINLNGAFNFARIVGERMRDGNGGTILNISSVAGRDGIPGMAHYSAAKAGMNNLTRTLGYEWAPFGIRVNGIMPGLVSTEGVESQLGISVADIDRTVVDRQIGTPDEIAALAQFLASPAASYIQSETVVAEGVPRIAKTEHHPPLRKYP